MNVLGLGNGSAACTTLAEDSLVPGPTSDGSQLSVIPAPGDLTPFSVFLRHMHSGAHTHTQTHM